MKETASKVLSLNFMGCLWGYIGMNLLRKGLPDLFSHSSWKIALILVPLACLIGFLKAKYVLRKTANRLLLRLERVKSYFNIFKLFDLKFVILIACMMAIGVFLNRLPDYLLLKGVIRSAIGFGLLQSSFYFFKPAFIYGIRG